MARSHEDELMAYIKFIHALSDVDLPEANCYFHKLAERVGKERPDRAQFYREVIAVLMAETYQRSSVNFDVPGEGEGQSLGL